MALQDRLDAFKADFVTGKLAVKPTKERLDAEIRAATKDARRPKPFEERFGSLGTAHRMSAYQPKPPNYVNDPEARIGSIVRSVAAAIISGVETRSGRVIYSDEACLVTIDGYLRMAIGIAWSAPNGIPGVFWSIRLRREIESHLTLIIRMDAANDEVQAYYLLPSNDLSHATKGQLRLSNPVFRDACRFEDLEALHHALVSAEPRTPA
jgi:hypothetical protein